MRVYVVAALALGACTFTGQGGAPGGDDGDDGMDMPGPDDHCFGADYTICLASLPTGPAILPASIDTSRAACPGTVIDHASGFSACLIAGTTIDIDSTVTARGELPLVLLATQTFIHAGTIDVSSTRDARGAGADASACGPGGDGSYNNGKGTGGAGGSFGTPGGNGGFQSSFSGGTASVASTAQSLRGGCRGGAGGGAQGDAGHGGGAVYLVAGGSIAISGIVNASGFAGEGGAYSGGGGGGGSGGMIVLDAPVANISGILVANGGGGGGGGSVSGTAQTGGVAVAQDPMTPATGGQGDPSNGGNGAGGIVDATVGASAGQSGGGGGGGFGVIRIVSGAPSTTNAKISPSAL